MTAPDRRIELRPLTRAQIAVLVGVPLAWAALLWFHPDVDPDRVYESLRDQVDTYLVVHVGTLVFIGLMGVALYLLVRDLPGRAATVSRLAIGPFVLFYAAWETVIGLAIGVLVQHANDAPARERPAVADAIQAVGGNVIIGDAGILLAIGALAWITAVIAAAVALHGAGAPLLAVILVGLSAVVVSHPPPIGPVGLVCFAAAAGVIAVSRRASPGVVTAARRSASAPG